jgi:hypothetical protein
MVYGELTVQHAGKADGGWAAVSLTIRQQQQHKAITRLVTVVGSTAMLLLAYVKPCTTNLSMGMCSVSETSLVFLLQLLCYDVMSRWPGSHQHSRSMWSCRLQNSSSKS